MSNDVEIRTLFDAGVSVDLIRAKYGITRRQIGVIVSNGKTPPLASKEIVKRYQEGWALDRLGVWYCVDSSVIRQVLMDSGHEVRSWGDHSKRYNYDRRFFRKIDDPIKAYWLGFLFGDGNVDNRLRQITLRLSLKDRAHLVQFALDLGFESGEAVRDGTGPSFGNKQVDYSSLVVSSVDMTRDLFDKGMVPNKSLVVSGPDNLPAELEYHFIRGLLDADGTISRRGGYNEMSLVGSYGLLAWVASKLPGNTTVSPHKTIWRIRSKAGNVQEWANLIYENSSRRLDRKFREAKKFKEFAHD